MPFTTYSRKGLTSLQRKYGCPRWFDAVYSGDLDYIKRHQKNINKRDELGYSALHHAAIGGLREVVDLLVTMGEDVDGKGQDGSTPLRCAVQEGHTCVVKILLDKGASLTDKDEDGLTVLHCAAGEGHGTIVSTLLASAPWLANEQTRSGWSPLHSAAVMGHAQVAGLLLDSGANSKLRNNQGKTAGDLAKERNKLEVSRRIDQVEPGSPSPGESRAEEGGVLGEGRNVQVQEGEGAGEELKCSDGVRAILECPVCLEVMSECKIYQCKFGHNVCERCCRNPLLSSCPQCREPYRHMRVRNLGLEELARIQ